MILLAGIQATAQNARPVIILKGEASPFEGILLTESYAKQIQADLDAKDEFKSELQKCLENQKEPSHPMFDSGLIFSSGIVLGLVTGFFLTRK